MPHQLNANPPKFPHHNTTPVATNPYYNAKANVMRLKYPSNVSNRYVESPASSSVRVRVRALTSPVAVNTFIKTFNKAFVVTSEA